MNLATLIVQDTQLGVAIEAADLAFTHGELDRLWLERDALHLRASHMLAVTQDEAVFQAGMVAQYAEFLGDNPALKRDRNAACDAIQRLASSIMGYLKPIA